jgi:hypothetical protein
MTATNDNGHRRYHTRGYGPPRFQEGPFRTGLQLGPLAFLTGSWRGLASTRSGDRTTSNRRKIAQLNASSNST